MCNDSKSKMADSLRQLMQKKPLKKISVSELMDHAGMTRQSFYYHFQCIEDVLEWYCDCNFREKLLFDPQEENRSWLLRCQSLLDADRQFYKRILDSVDRHRIVLFCEPIVRPQIMRLLMKENAEETLSHELKSAVDFLTRSGIYYFIDILTDSRAFNADSVIEEIYCLFSFITGVNTKRVMSGPKQGVYVSRLDEMNRQFALSKSTA